MLVCVRLVENAGLLSCSRATAYCHVTLLHCQENANDSSKRMGIPGGLPQWSVIDPSAILRMTESLIIVHFL